MLSPLDPILLEILGTTALFQVKLWPFFHFSFLFSLFFNFLLFPFFHFFSSFSLFQFCFKFPRALFACKSHGLFCVPLQRWSGSRPRRLVNAKRIRRMTKKTLLMVGDTTISAFAYSCLFYCCTWGDSHLMLFQSPFSSFVLVLRSPNIFMTDFLL